MYTREKRSMKQLDKMYYSFRRIFFKAVSRLQKTFS